jgi:4-amino-4-deoxy-L-arabinose transferase-like glycosyltransferase
MPIADTLQFDPDEGIELAKASLYSSGYSLYDQIWDDQPPLLTVLLAEWLKVFGSHIVAARLLILGLSAVLVGCFFSTLFLILGAGPALIGTVGLCLTLDFLRLSVSVMQGLPALAFVMAAVYLLLRVTQSPLMIASPSSAAVSHKSRLPWLTLGIIASGICFGLSLQIKLYTVLLLPACLSHLILGPSIQDWQLRPNRIHHGLVWLGACLLTVVGIGLLNHSFSSEQLLGAHFEEAAQSLQHEPSWQILIMFLAQDLDYFLLATVGTWILLRYQRSWPILPLVWLVSVLLGLTYYQPLWYHYYPLISIPVVWLGTYGVAQSFSLFQKSQWLQFLKWDSLKHPTLKSLTAIFITLTIILAPIKIAVLAFENHIFLKESKENLEVINQLKVYASQTHWLLTDLPIAAFYLNLKVPPDLAVFSTKRVISGSINPKKLKQILKKYRPEQVLLGRYEKINAALEPYLSEHYIRRYQKDKVIQYIRKDQPSN